MSVSIVAAALLAYGLALFSVGWFAQRRPEDKQGRGSSGLLALAIGVYCTSWTFYGAVGTAARSGWDYLPIYLGPILIFTFGLGLMRRLVALAKGHGATSLSDLLSRRFGRSRRLAALITASATLVSIPYVALQLVAVATTFAEVTGSVDDASPIVILTVGGVLAGFAIVFGTQNKDITKSRRGLVAAIAFDSLFKLIAFVVIAVVAVFSMQTRPEAESIALLNQPISIDRFLVLTILASCAMFCLPRQFHMAIVEARSTNHLHHAAPIVVLYLATFSIFAVPLAIAGPVLVPGGSTDLFVLSIPEALGAKGLALLGFTGGFAAAAGMVIVAGVALSTMVASDLILPLLSRSQGHSVFGSVLLVRRVALCALLLVAALFATVVPREAGLASFGTVSFAGAGQFAPLVLAALFMPVTTERGAFIGLMGGMTAWAAFVLAPAFFPGSPVDLSQGLARALPFFSDDFTRGTIASIAVNILLLLVISLWQRADLKEREDAARFAAISTHRHGASVTAEDLRTLLGKTLGTEEADSFMSRESSLTGRTLVSSQTIERAEAKLSRVLGNASANILVSGLLSGRRVAAGDVMVLMGDASRELRFSQELLATTLDNLAEGVSVIDAHGTLVAWNKAYDELFGYPVGMLRIGLPLSQLISHNLPNLTNAEVEQRVERLLQGHPYTNETKLADGRIVRFQGRPAPGGGYVTSFSDVSEYRNAQMAVVRQEEETRFYTDNIPFPIASSDRCEVIRFHNKAFAMLACRGGEDLTGLSLHEVFGQNYDVRKPAIDSALAGRVQRFVLGPEEIGGSVTWQITYSPSLDDNGHVSGFFGFYQDISQRRAAQAAIEEANRMLESRVVARTVELRRTNVALESARKEAERANHSKTRFLAAASHDVLQPINAARLFASSLEDSLEPGSAERTTAERIGRAIASADTLLRSLLNLARLEAGGIEVCTTFVPLQAYLENIVEEFEPLAEAKGLRLGFVATDQVTRTDPGVLRSAIQNLISNALRYTDQGGIVIGVRRRGTGLALEISDTGRGIAEDDLDTVFEEFKRLQRDADVEGAGLGLSTVKRTTELLGHRLEVRSRLDQGTTFRIHMDAVTNPAPALPEPTRTHTSLKDRVIFCIDNDPSVLSALVQRFEQWGAIAYGFHGIDDLRDGLAEISHQSPDLLILDYQLDDDMTGLEVYRLLRDERDIQCPAIVVTASRSHHVDKQVEELGLAILSKPVEPAALRALSVGLTNGQMD